MPLNPPYATPTHARIEAAPLPADARASWGLRVREDK